MKVAKNKPIPKKGGVGRKRTVFKFDLLKEVGDSILIKGDSISLRQTVYGSLLSYNKTKAKAEIKITIRTEASGIRVWRIK
jgi:hypothetical protein